jgi:tetratricopeptide (TPR) repeat protein
VGGAAKKATAVLQQLLQANPNLAGAHLQLAFIEAEGKRNVPVKAVRRLEKALQLGLDDVHEQAMAHQLLGQYRLDIGQGEPALQHLDQAVGAMEAIKEDTPIHPLYRARLYHMRSLAYQRLRQPELARQNAQQAITWAQNAADEQAIAYYQRELEIMEKQDGRL